MLEYQNLFTRVQVRTAPDAGLPIDDSTGDRLGTGGFSKWIGKLGDAQIGPIYLGATGLWSLLFGFLAFEIIGLNGGAAKMVTVIATPASGAPVQFEARVRIDTPKEREYFQHGGILQYVLRQLAGSGKAA